jgi:predicted nuclease of predicted toxin-antitoxin system
MRFLADENFPRASVELLRDAGHDVAAIAEDSPGIQDSAVLVRAAAEHRVILTFDRDYGELIYRIGLPPPPGLLYLRYSPPDPSEPAYRLLSLMKLAGFSLAGKYTVVERERVRQRPFAPAKPES